MATLDGAIEAVELFCERASEVDRAFEPTDADLAVIEGICTRLDGMPLAIELAASRVRQMSLIQLDQRLEDRFRLLRSAARDGAAERQKTLRATVEWSYRLLSEHERALFERLSVFAGSFDDQAAEQISGFDPLLEMDVFDMLA